MIRATVILGSDGSLRRFEAAGHSGLELRGSDIVCAAFTGIVRSAAKVLEADEGVTVSGDAPECGVLQFSVTSAVPGKGEWLDGVRDFLLQGLKDLSAEFPDHCSVSIEHEG